MERQLLLASLILPLVGVLGCLHPRIARRTGAISLASSLGMLGAAFLTSAAVAEPQVATAIEWLPQAQFRLVFGIDGLNLPLLLLLSIAFPLISLFREDRVRDQFLANAILLSAQFAGFAAALSLDALGFLIASFALGFGALAFGASFCQDSTGRVNFRRGLRLGLGGALVLVGAVALYQSTLPRTFAFWEMNPDLNEPFGLAVLALVLVGTAIRSPLETSEEPGPTTTGALLWALSAVVAWYGAIRLSLSALLPALALARPWILGLGSLVALGSVATAWRRARGDEKAAQAPKWLLLSHAGTLLIALGLMERTAITGGLLLSWIAPLSWIALATLRPWSSPALFALPVFAAFPGLSLLLFGAYLDQAGVPILAALAATAIATSLIYWDLLKRKEASPRPAWWGTRIALLLLLAILGVAGISPGPLVDRIRPTVALLLAEGK